MKPKFVATGNVKRLIDAFVRVEARPVPEHAFILVDGKAGLGKSRASAWLSVQRGGRVIRVHSSATVGWVLRSLCHELGLPAARSVETLHKAICEELDQNPRPLVIDEADEGLRQEAMIMHALRAISDEVMVPIVLVGADGAAGRLQHRPQIARRVGAVARFERLGLEDVRLVADQLCEAEIPDWAVERVLATCEGYIDRAIADLAKVEALAKRGKLTPGGLAAAGLGSPLRREAAAVAGMTARAQKAERAAERAAGDGSLAAKAAAAAGGGDGS